VEKRLTFLGLAGLLTLACPLARGEAAKDQPVGETIEKPTHDSPNNTGPTSPSRVLPGEPTAHKNYLIPLVEIPVFQLTLNGVDRLIYGSKDYGVNLQTGVDHIVNGRWVVDRDAFTVNQIGHPYQGAMYYGFARSAGLNFWEGLLYSNLGSWLWETWGETTTPSINDQVASGTAGALVGEPLFRMSRVFLERGGEHPSVLRRVGAAAISPATELNHLIFGSRYDTVLQREPAIFTRLSLGGGANESISDIGSSRHISRGVGTLDFAIAYGQPGKPGYRYLRPFDYFDFRFSVLTENRNFFEDVSTRGLLFGSKYEAGDALRGVWGLYGTFDYLSPEIFRVSSTAGSFGTTAQWWMSRNVALQGTALTGLGYAAAGTIHPEADDIDYHYGLTPQGLGALRLIFGTRAMIDANFRAYYITGVGGGFSNGTEQINRLDAGFLVRLVGCHALGLHYLSTSRNVRQAEGTLSLRHQRVGTIVVAYSLLGSPTFGAVHWQGRNSNKD
jgi:hypothetical protein